MSFFTQNPNLKRYFFFDVCVWGGGGVGRRGAGVRGFFFTKNPNKRKKHILDLELAIDHPPPKGVLYTIIF